MRPVPPRVSTVQLPKLDNAYYQPRPTTPRGRFEHTHIDKIKIDTKDRTSDELAYTRYEMDTIARLRIGRTFNDITSQLPEGFQGTVRPDLNYPLSSAQAVAPPNLRENGVTVTRRDNELADHLRRPQANPDDTLQPGLGTPTVIHHNPGLGMKFGDDVIDNDGTRYQQVEIFDASGNPERLDEALSSSTAGLAHEIDHLLQNAAGVVPTESEVRELTPIRAENLVLKDLGAPGQLRRTHLNAPLYNTDLVDFRNTEELDRYKKEVNSTY